MMRRSRGVGAGLDEIESLYRARLREFQRLATALTSSRELGCDAVQDAFAQAVHRRGEFRAEGSLDGWLWRIVVNAARDARRRWPDSRVLPLEEGAEVEGTADGAHGDGVVREVVVLLPERQRLALFLRYYADLDYGAIAEVLGVTAGTVAATLHQAHANVRQLMMEVSR